MYVLLDFLKAYNTFCSMFLIEIIVSDAHGFILCSTGEPSMWNKDGGHFFNLQSVGTEHSVQCVNGDVAMIECNSRLAFKNQIVVEQ